jgi:hypothetical protein
LVMRVAKREQRGDSTVGGASAKVTPRSYSEGLAWWLRPIQGTGWCCEGLSDRKPYAYVPAVVMHAGCRYPLEGTIVVTFLMSSFG